MGTPTQADVNHRAIVNTLSWARKQLEECKRLMSEADNMRMKAVTRETAIMQMIDHLNGELGNQ